jgi:hypothetical protein
MSACAVANALQICRAIYSQFETNLFQIGMIKNDHENFMEIALPLRELRNEGAEGDLISDDFCQKSIALMPLIR